MAAADAALQQSSAAGARRGHRRAAACASSVKQSAHACSSHTRRQGPAAGRRATALCRLGSLFQGSRVAAPSLACILAATCRSRRRGLLVGVHFPRQEQREYPTVEDVQNMFGLPPEVAGRLVSRRIGSAACLDSSSEDSGVRVEVYVGQA